MKSKRKTDLGFKGTFQIFLLFSHFLQHYFQKFIMKVDYTENIIEGRILLESFEELLITLKVKHRICKMKLFLPIQTFILKELIHMRLKC